MYFFRWYFDMCFAINLVAFCKVIVLQVRGATAHYDAVVNAATSGCLGASTSTGVPVIFGVLTTDDMDQVGLCHNGKSEILWFMFDEYMSGTHMPQKLPVRILTRWQIEAEYHPDAVQLNLIIHEACGF